MEKRRSLAIAFFVLLGAAGAFVIRQRVGSALDHHGRTVTVGVVHPQAPGVTPPVAQK